MCSGLSTGENPERGFCCRGKQNAICSWILAQVHDILSPSGTAGLCWTDTCSALGSVLERCLSPLILRASYVSSYSTSVLFIEKAIPLCAPHWGCGDLLIPVFLLMVFVILDANTHFLSTDAAFLAMEFSFFSTSLDKTVLLPQTFSLQCWFSTCPLLQQ